MGGGWCERDRMVGGEFDVSGIEFPAMRHEIVLSLASLADVEYQRRAWINAEFEREGRYEDLSLVVNILYDDTGVLPEPGPAVGRVVFEGEVLSLRALGSALTPLIDRLGDSSDAFYLEAAEWSTVVAAAGVALATMVRHGSLDGPGGDPGGLRRQ